MKFGILNSIKGSDTYFKDALFNIFKSEGDTLILGYGYFSNNIFYLDPNKKYERKFKLQEIRDFEKEFYDTLVKGFKNCTNTPKIIITGHKEDFNKKTNLFKYYEALGIKIYYKLKKENINADVRVFKTGAKYHKKVAFKFYNADRIRDIKPVMLMIGSSNLTRQGFHLNDDFNQEVDVLFWNNYVVKNNKDILSLIEAKELSESREMYNNFIIQQRIRLGKSKDFDENYDKSTGVSLEVYTYIYSLSKELRDAKEIKNKITISNAKERMIELIYLCIDEEKDDIKLRELLMRRDDYIYIIYKNDFRNIINEINKEPDLKSMLKDSKVLNNQSVYGILEEVLTGGVDELVVEMKLNSMIYGTFVI